MSAIIYQFPVEARSAAVGARRDDVKRAAAVTAQRLVKTVHGGAWYHDEAIKDEECARNT